MKDHLFLNKLTIAFGLLVTFMPFSVIHAQSKPWVAPVQYANLSNPSVASPDKVNAGKVLYQTYCSPCHGTKGKGDGAAAVALTPKPADHTSPAMANETDGSLFYKISEGRTPMPKYKEAFTEQQRWELIDYIRTLSKTQKK